MFDSLLPVIWHYLRRLILLPVSLWINYRWVVLRHQETCHLLRLDDYLLKDMGLRKVGDRIEAIEPSRIDSERNIFSKKETRTGNSKRHRHAN